MSAPIVVAGASLGGLRTAESIRRAGSTRPVVVIGAEPHRPYNRTPLSKEALHGGVAHEKLAYPLRTVIDDVRWRLGTQIVAADLDRRVVTDDTGRRQEYAALVIATGVSARSLPLAGGERLPGRFSLRTLDDAVRLRAQLTPGRKVVVAGGGFVGCEIAATARSLGCDVTVVDLERHPMSGAVGAELALDLERHHAARGVRFVPEARIVAVGGRGRVEEAILDDGSVLACDVLVEAVGSAPNTGWLAGNDLDLDRGVRTDSAMRAVRADGCPWGDVFVVGDVARFPHPIFEGESRAIEHWNMPTETARRAGRILALRLAGPDREEELQTAINESFAPMPSFWSDQYDLHLQAYGVPALGDEARLLHGTPGTDCVYGYLRRGALVGVCGIGHRSLLQGYRHDIAAAWTAAAVGAA